MKIIIYKTYWKMDDHILKRTLLTYKTYKQYEFTE